MNLESEKQKKLNIYLVCLILTKNYETARIFFQNYKVISFKFSLAWS